MCSLDSICEPCPSGYKLPKGVVTEISVFEYASEMADLPATQLGGRQFIINDQNSFPITLQFDYELPKWIAQLNTQEQGYYLIVNMKLDDKYLTGGKRLLEDFKTLS
jgi:hypothetical protein